MEQQSPHTLSKVHIRKCRPARRRSGPLPLSLRPGLWTQACLCVVSMAPYVGIKHKWAGDQLKHSPCLFVSPAGNTHPHLSSQRPQFSSAVQIPQHVFINFSRLERLSPHPQVELFEYIIVAFFKGALVMWQHSDDFTGQWLIFFFFYTGKHLCSFILYKEHFRCQKLKTERQDVGSSSITLNTFMCFLLPSLSRHTEHISRMAMENRSPNALLHPHEGDWWCFRLRRHLNTSTGIVKDISGALLDGSVFDFMLHAMKKWLRWDLTGSCVSAAVIQPLSNLSQHASVWVSRAQLLHSMTTGIQTRISHFTAYWGSVRCQPAWQCWCYSSSQWRH